VVLATLANALSTLSTVVYALTPKASLALRAALGFAESSAAPAWSHATDLIKAGTPFGDVPRLFPRFEMPAKKEG
jgi:methionyl-tRNA synthetase